MVIKAIADIEVMLNERRITDKATVCSTQFEANHKRNTKAPHYFMESVGERKILLTKVRNAFHVMTSSWKWTLNDMFVY